MCKNSKILLGNLFCCNVLSFSKHTSQKYFLEKVAVCSKEIFVINIFMGIQYNLSCFNTTVFAVYMNKLISYSCLMIQHSVLFVSLV